MIQSYTTLYLLDYIGRTLHLLKDKPEDGLVIRPKHVAEL